MNVIERLGDVPAFRGLSDDTFLHLLPAIRLASVAAGTLLAFEGRSTWHTTVLLEGQLGAYVGTERIDGESWGPGTALGCWAEEVDRSPASFVIRTPGRILALPKALVSHLGIADGFREHAPIVEPQATVADRSVPDLVLANAMLGDGYARALDIGAGGGRFSELLRAAALSALVTDVDPEALVKCRARFEWLGLDGVDVQEMDGQALTLDDASVDLVGTRLAAHHVADLPKLLTEIRRVLRPGGCLLVVDLIANSVAASLQQELERALDPTHVQARTPTQWRQALNSAGFVIERDATTRRRASIDQRIAPEGATARTRCAALLESASPDECAALGVFDRAGHPDGWAEERLVLLARREAK